ncbi:MAG: histidine kinase, partial [Flavobacterium sp.]|nr:histidine kinase [Candidatus Neoflavobacterium equi]
MQKEISLLNDKVALEKDLSKSVLTSIKSQMNPHFFYNALNTIQAFIFTHDNQKANNYLAKFSKLTRMILEMSEKETVSMQEELVTLKLYLDLEKMRFDRDFNYEITVDPAVEVDLISFPPMLIQPYVENSIKHGLLHRDGEKKVSISFDQVEDLLFVSIDDNGIGRARAAALKQIKSQNHESFASQANEKRLEILNKGRSHKISAEIIDKKSKEGIATGTLVVLVLPIN